MLDHKQTLIVKIIILIAIVSIAWIIGFFVGVEVGQVNQI